MAQQTIVMSITLSIQGVLSLTSGTPPTGTVGQPYSHQFSVTGGTPPYAWSVQSGTLPPGLTLSASGLLSGTPSVAGNFPVTIAVADSGA